jgi:hypothetical protein
MSRVGSAWRAQANLGRVRLADLYPAVAPWTQVALWHGFRTYDPPDTPLDAEVMDICNQRLAGLLLRYLQDHDVSIDPRLKAQLLRASFRWTSLSFAVAASGAAMAADLARCGVPVAVSKGPGIARYYDAADLRPYSDIDLLVSKSDFGAALELASGRGWTEEVRNRQPRQFVGAHTREAINLTRGLNESIDLHQRIPPWIWSAGLSPAELISRSAVVDVGGTDTRCLDAVDNLLVASLHIVSDRNRPGASLIVWRDIVELASVVDVDEAVGRAKDAGLAGWLRCVLEALPSSTGTEGLLASLPDDPDVQHPWRLRLMLSQRSERMGVVSSQVLRLPMLNGAMFVAGMAAPSRQFLADKYPESRHPYLRWWGNSGHRLRGLLTSRKK